MKSFVLLVLKVIHYTFAIPKVKRLSQRVRNSNKIINLATHVWGTKLSVGRDQAE